VVVVLPTIQEAMAYVQSCSSTEEDIEVLVTRDLHLVGGLFSLLEQDWSRIRSREIGVHRRLAN